MQIIRTLLAFLSLTSIAFCQYQAASVEVEQFVAIIAKSVKTEPMVDSVAVFLTERQAEEKTGAFLKITSESKWATPYSQDAGVSLLQSKATPGTWMMYAKPGLYKLLVIEFDPEKGPMLSNVEAKVGKVPDKPVDPPTIDFASLVNVAKSTADKLNDPPTRSALKLSTQGLLLAGKTYDEAKTIVTSARQVVFLARQGNSRLVDWDSWRIAVDVELKKAVNAGDADRYRAAIAAIASAL